MFFFVWQILRTFFRILSLLFERKNGLKADVTIQNIDSLRKVNTHTSRKLSCLRDTQVKNVLVLKYNVISM